MARPTIRYPYEDPAVDVERRVEDLISRMEPEDKAGLMFHPMATFGPFAAKGLLGTPSVRVMLERRINHFNVLTAPSAREIAEWHNAVQREALKHPLAIPVTLSTDPRHSFTDNPATALFAGPFSQWPEPMGFAAIGDVALVRTFSEIVRREYLAVGLRLALHPQVDLASDPRWSRAAGTFGTDPALSGALAAAQIEALRAGPELGPRSVSAMVKHFPGGGAQKDGEDPHFDYGREQVYPGGRFELHLEPFRRALGAGVTQVMPYYGMPVDLQIDDEPVEEVGFAFNRTILTGVLRERLGFDGIICSDWRILGAKYWGVEELTYEQRMLRALSAGVDQFGGETRAPVLARLIRSGGVSAHRVDESVRRLLREKFRLGLFDHRFVDADTADAVVGSATSRELGVAAQAAAVVLLKNEPGDAFLPLAAGLSVYLEGADPEPFAHRATVVGDPRAADVAIVRLVAPWTERGEEGDVQRYFHAGSLEFDPEVLAHLRELSAVVPTVVDVYLERPALLGELVEHATVLTANFGAGSEALARVVFGEVAPRGRLPFEIPRSMAAVESSREDVPNDTVDPVFPVGSGVVEELCTPATSHVTSPESGFTMRTRKDDRP